LTNKRERCDVQTGPIVQILSGFNGATCPSTVLAAFHNTGVFLIIHPDYEGIVIIIIYSDVRVETPRCEFERLAQKEAVMAVVCAENYEDTDLDPNEVEEGRKYSDRQWMDEEGEEYKDKEGVE
jgi:dUTPase